MWQELAALADRYTHAAQEVVRLAEGACAAPPFVSQLAAQLTSTTGALAAFERGIGVDGAAMRAELSEAIHFLLPLCTLLSPALVAKAAPK